MGVNLHVDLETIQLIQGPGQRSAVAALRFKRGDAARLQVVFLESGTTPASTMIATSRLVADNQESDRRIKFHKSCFDAVWRNPDASPADIIEALGTSAVTYFQAASESVRHIAEIAELSGIPLDDLLSPEDREMHSEVIFHEDGTATVTMASTIDTPS